LSAVTEALQAYADRGVFRGFRATPGPRGRIVYEFKWLTRKPVRAEFDSRANTLRFPDLFPALDKSSAAAMAAVIASRTQRGIAAHKRIDGRRAGIAGKLTKGAYALTVTVRGGNHEYAASIALNVINDMFVTLQEHHPEYLIEQFGMSPE
jgi:hypothetical protein